MSTTTTSEFGRVALGYAASDGWHVFPLHTAASAGCSCGKATCDRKSWGKHPRTANGLKDATADPDQIRAWWQKWPDANVGVRTGADTGLVMVGPDGEQGIADLAELERHLGPLPRTRRAKSGSGGEHYYLRWPADGRPIKNRKNHLGTKIDVRGDGGYFVAPPSVNEKGRYEWLDQEAGFAELPPAWAEWCRTDERKTPAAPPGGFSATAAGGCRSPAEERARKYLAKMPAAVSGQRGHDALFAAARALVWGFDLGVETALAILADEYNPRCLPPWSERELRHKCEDAASKPFDKPRGHLLAEAAPPPVRAEAERVRTSAPPPPDDKAAVFKRAADYLSACPASANDRFRSANLAQACHAAAWGFGLDERAALAAVSHYFNLRCKPKWNDKDLRRELRLAAERPAADRPRGHLAASPDPVREFPPERMPPPVAADGVPVDRPDNPHRLAAGFVAAQPGRLRHHRETFYEYAGGAYRPLPDGEVKARLTAWLRAEFLRLGVLELARWRAAGGEGVTPPPTVRMVTQRVVGDTLNAVRSVTLLPGDVCPPAWVDGADGPDPRHLLAVRNGLLHLPDRRLLPPDPAFFTLNALAFDYDPDAPTPAGWERFLVSLWGDPDPRRSDTESLSALQEWFGYLLAADTSLQKVLMVIGPKRSGKGTIARTLRAMVGERNYAAPTLSALAGEFGLAPLLGKTVAVVSDARLSGRTDGAAVAERLLTISGEDGVQVNRKFLPPVETRLATRFVIMSNELPKLGDSSGALTGRMVVLRLTRSFFGKEDPGLSDRLTAELPGILLWAIEGLDRLRDRGRFHQPASGVELIEDLEELASPVGAFVSDRCVLGPEHRVPVAELFSEWKGWCERHGRDHPGTEQSFGRDLRAAVPTLIARRPRIAGGDRIREYMGIGLRAAGDAIAFP